jgi:hypothetical protein
MLATVLVLCALQEAPGAAPDVSAVLAALERAAIDGDAGRDALASELARPGPAAIPGLFEVLASGSSRVPDAREEQALVAALSSFGAPPLRAFLERRLATERTPEERIAALHLIASFGTGADLLLLRRAAAGAGSAVEGALQGAAAGLLRRDPRALEALRRWMLEAPGGIAAALAHGAGDSACPQALGALAETLGYRADLDPLLLGELARLLAREEKPVDEGVLAPIEEALTEDDARVLREAALALGHAQDPQAVPQLIALLAHETRGVRTAAHWALERITGLDLGATEGRWSSWLREEERWFAESGARLALELRTSEAEVAIRALGELSSHRWRRHELALETAAALDHPSPTVRRLACLALARLGSAAAEPGLERALEDEDESVARAALLALETLAAEPGASRRRTSSRRRSSGPPGLPRKQPR